MARHYSTKDFFRQMPNALLARYFQGRGLLDHLNFTTLKDTQPDDLFAAWLSLPETQRNTIDAEFREIFAMSCEKGLHAILDEAVWHLRATPEKHTELVETLAALGITMSGRWWPFLDHPKSWRGATLFYHADTLPYWRKRKGLPHQAASVHEEGRQALAGGVSHYFHRTEGRGKNCVVEGGHSAGVNLTIFLPTRRTTRNTTSSGLTESLIADPITQPSR